MSAAVAFSVHAETRPVIEFLFDGSLRNTGTIGGTGLFSNPVPGEEACFGEGMINGCLDLTRTKGSAADKTVNHGGAVAIIAKELASATAVTVTGIIYPSAVDDLPRRIVSCSPLFQVYAQGGNLACAVANAKNETKWLSPRIAASANAPVYFAVSIDSSAKVFSAYQFTGAKLVKTAAEIDLPADAAAGAKIEIGNLNGQRPFKGFIDNVRIYNSVLPESDLAQIMKADTDDFVVPSIRAAVFPLKPAFEFSDRFDRYADREALIKKYLLTGINWAPTQAGLVLRSAPDNTFAVLRDEESAEMTVSAVMSVRESPGATWRMMGPAVYLNSENYWTTFFLAYPDGSKHSVGLGMRLDNSWPSEQKLTRTKATPGFAWEWNTPYRVSITISESNVSGRCEKMDGGVCWETAYALSGSAVTQGRAAMFARSVDARVSDFSVRAQSVLPRTQPVSRAYARPGIAEIARKKTGYFRTENIDGRWWFIDPNGNGFLAVSVDQLRFNDGKSHKLGYSPVHRVREAKYGSSRQWADSVISRMDDWGFSAVGIESTALAEANMPYTEWLKMGDTFSFIGDEYNIVIPENYLPHPGMAFPNVFHPEFPAHCAIVMDQRTERFNDPYLIGYFIDNELGWFGDKRVYRHQVSYGLFEHAMKKPPTHTAKLALIAYLKGKYGDIRAFNKAWGADIASFEAIAPMKELFGSNAEQVKKDKDGYVRLVAERYFAITTHAIRKADPNHLILGCRFAGVNSYVYEELYDIYGRYSDVVSINWYAHANVDDGYLYEPIPGYGEYRVADYARYIGSRTKRPMMITEWSYHGLDAGLPCTYAAGQRVKDQTARSKAFSMFQETMFSLPFCIGTVWYKWTDDHPDGGQAPPNLSENGNYGLVNSNDEPYPLLNAAVKEVNARVFDLHKSTPLTGPMIGPITSAGPPTKKVYLAPKSGDRIKDPGNKGAGEGYADSSYNDDAWKTMKLPGLWEQEGLMINGAVWFRLRVTIPMDWEGKDILLSLGTVDDYDIAYFNGKEVGATDGKTAQWWTHKRAYPVPGDRVQAGDAVIAVRVFDDFSGGGITGPEGIMKLSRKDGGGEIKLGGEWKYKVEFEVSETVGP